MSWKEQLQVPLGRGPVGVGLYARSGTGLLGAGPLSRQGRRCRPAGGQPPACLTMSCSS